MQRLDPLYTPLAGFNLIEADSLEEAQAYAKMLSGTVEVRACVAS